MRSSPQGGVEVAGGRGDQADPAVELARGEPGLEVAGQVEDVADQQVSPRRPPIRSWPSWPRDARPRRRAGVRGPRAGGPCSRRPGRGLAPRPTVVDGPGDEPLSRAGLADDQHRDVERRGRRDLVEQPAMLRPSADRGRRTRGGREQVLADLDQLDPEPVGLGVGDLRGRVRGSDQADQPDQATFGVVERPELDPSTRAARRRRGGSGRSSPRAGRPSPPGGGQKLIAEAVESHRRGSGPAARHSRPATSSHRRPVSSSQARLTIWSRRSAPEHEDRLASLLDEGVQPDARDARWAA